MSSDAQFDDKGGLEGPIEKVEFHNGNTYAGEWHQGEMHGRGAFTWSERGITYKGMFNENHATGVGMCVQNVSHKVLILKFFR